MKRTLLAVLGMALVASAASAADFDCRKAKAASFTATTIPTVTSDFGTQNNVAVKKPFLYCNDGTNTQVCYKVKGTKVADGARSTTDQFGSLSLTVKGKTFLLCTPAT